MSPTVEVNDLVVRYGDLTAVDGVSFTAEAGAVTVVLGPNGAGKTTTIETIEGYRRPAAGSVRVFGLDPVVHHRQLVERVGVMLQEGGVHPGVRASEALRLYASFYASPLDPESLLERVGLGGRRRATWRQLSGGERQRLSLALSLVGRPQVVFLDEPTSGVDVGGRQVIRSIVGELRDSGAAVVLTTHELDEAERLADRVVIVDRGRVVGTGTPAELMASEPSNEIRFGAPAGLDAAALGRAIGAAVAEIAPGEYRIAAAPTPATVAAVTAWLAEHDLPLTDLRAGRHRLEDVFLRLTAPEPSP